ncbi:MAG: hypothetical protein U9N44_03990 [Chloroflexota bacterium]|nr:hypothetical protein [Chloroflexota bacterium]
MTRTKRTKAKTPLKHRKESAAATHSRATTVADPLIRCDFCGRKFIFSALKILPNEQQICKDCLARMYSRDPWRLSQHRCNPRRRRNEIKAEL